jgi:hypothetical protein
MPFIGIALWIGLALLISFRAAHHGFDFASYLILALLWPFMAWQTLRVAKWLNRRNPPM